MLLSKTVKVKWHSKTKKHYEEKGYVYTKIGDEFEVKVEDLLRYSISVVDVECDGCKKELKDIVWKNYLKCVHNDGTYYCIVCAMKLYGNNKIKKTKLQKSKSFERWCSENGRKDILDRWDYSLNDCKPSDVSYGSKTKYWFECQSYLHPSELKNINSFTNNKLEGTMDCNACNSFAQWGFDNICLDFLEKYWDYEKNIDINPWEIDKCSHKKVWIKCQEKNYHESYRANCSRFVLQGDRCPCCSNRNGRVHPLDSLGKLLEDRGLLYLWSEKNKKSPYEYAPFSEKEVLWKCPGEIHDDFKRSICNSNYYNFRCPHCSRERDESVLQEKVRLYLNDLGYTVLHEHNCNIIINNPKCSGKLGQMPFDNELVELKLLVEVMGKQHYEISGWTIKKAKEHNISSEQEFKRLQIRDRYKRIKAKQLGYEYIAIPHWTDNKNNEWEWLIDNKIIEINNKNLGGIL